jgi:hypothetical protein
MPWIGLAQHEICASDSPRWTTVRGWTSAGVDEEALDDRKSPGARRGIEAQPEVALEKPFAKRW